MWRKIHHQSIPSIKLLLNLNPHGIGSTNNGLRNGLERHVLTVRIALLDLGDLVHVLEGECGGGHVTRAAAAVLDSGRLLEVPRDGGRLDRELEGVVCKRGYGHGHGGFGLVFLGPGVEVLAESH